MDNFSRRIKDGLLKLPLITWVLLGFFITFLSFFILPIFLNPSQEMQFNRYVLVVSPIGYDFKAIVSFSSAWIHSGELVPIVYPSFTLIFFAPFTLFESETGYKLVVFISLLCYVFITLVLPQWINHSKGISPLAMLLFVTGLLSYGLQFELERGQWNVIAFTFSLLAVYLFHDHPRLRWLSYVFFTIAVQLKLYPAIFVFVLVEDGSDWKNNIKRFVGLGLVNLLALFMFGVSPVLNTFNYMVQSEASHVGRPFNLSISSFVLQILSLRFLPHKRIILWLQANPWLPQFILLAIFGVCFVIILRRAYKKDSKGLNPIVFLACTIGACLVPALSFDYKLAFLPASVILLFPILPSFEQGGKRFSIIFITFLFSLAYSSMLYSYTDKPEILQYNLPALFVLLMICVVLAYVRWDGMGVGDLGVPEVDSNSQ